MHDFLQKVKFIMLESMLTDSEIMRREPSQSPNQAISKLWILLVKTWKT